MNRKQRRIAAKLGQAPGGSRGETAATAVVTPGAAELLAAGLKHQEARQLADAEACYRRVLAGQPDHPDALHLLGVIAHQVGRHDIAVDLIGQAIKRNGQNAIFFSNLGVALKAQNKLDEVVAAYRQAIRLKPDYAEAYSNLGYALWDQGKLSEAVAACRKAISLKPDLAEAHCNLGGALKDQGKLEEAVAACHQAIRLRPNNAEAFYNRGVALQGLNRFDEALASYGNALALRPDYAEASYNRGVTLQELKRLDEALAGYDTALALKPDYPQALYNRGIALQGLKRLDEALASYDKALALKPDSAEVFNNRGNVLQQLNRFDEALASYDKALALKSDHADAFNNRGVALQELKRLDEALASYSQALALKPDYAEARWNGSLLRLLTGDFERGWAESEWRWKNASLGLSERNFTQPLWLGAERIDGMTLMLHHEQGLGDAIQFCRYVPLLAARDVRVILEVEEPLRQLMSDLAGVSHCVSRGETLPDFDLHCPLPSLPLAFGTRLDTIPSTTPYLRAPAHGHDWEARLGPKDRPRIGLVWSGNPRHRDDRKRSIELSALLPLLNVGTTFVSLQKDIRTADEAVLRERSDIIELGPLLQSFADTAALISQLDLVISVDTSVAHLAGALGRPVWVLLPFVPDWRWLLDRDDSPWYPTARLFRQTDSRDWRDVVDHVRTALHHLVEK
jgi:tetratricopeptide (TPR) repeat protein